MTTPRRHKRRRARRQMRKRIYNTIYPNKNSPPGDITEDILTTKSHVLSIRYKLDPIATFCPSKLDLFSGRQVLHFPVANLRATSSAK
jgi:hypothetical protein